MSGPARIRASARSSSPPCPANRALPGDEDGTCRRISRRHVPTAWRLILGCSFNLLNGTLGPGMLVLPLAFHRTGLVFGVTLLSIIWAFSYLSLLLLLECCASLRSSSLVHLGREYGPGMSFAVDLSVLLYFYGTCISYLILIGGTFSTIGTSGAAAPSGGELDEGWGVRSDQLALIGFTLFLLMPLSCARSLERLGAFSSAILLLYGFITCVVWMCDAGGSHDVAQHPGHHGGGMGHRHHAAGGGGGAPHGADFTWRGQLLLIARAMPTMAYCFSSQAVYPPALESLQQLRAPYSPRRVMRVLTDMTFSLTLLAYLVVGVGGYVIVPGTPPPNVLDAYEPSLAVRGAQLCLICALGLSYPLMLIVARDHALSLMEGWLSRRGRSTDDVLVPVTSVGVLASPDRTYTCTPTSH